MATRTKPKKTKKPAGRGRLVISRSVGQSIEFFSWGNRLGALVLKETHNGQAVFEIDFSDEFFVPGATYRHDGSRRITLGLYDTALIIGPDGRLTKGQFTLQPGSVRGEARVSLRFPGIVKIMRKELL